MRIKKIVVSHMETQNLGDYSNVKPSVTLEAELGEGENVSETIKTLQAQAQQAVQQQVDNAFEAIDDPPKYYSGPRFAMIVNSREDLAAIVPDEALSNLINGWDGLSYRKKGRRLEAIKSYITHKYLLQNPETTVIDCSDGDLTKLPQLKDYKLERHDPSKIIVLIDPKQATLPGEGWFGWKFFYNRTLENLRLELPAKIKEGYEKYEDYKLFICPDGDYSSLPPLVEPEPELDNDDYDDDDYDDDDYDDDDDDDF